jgi:orotidine-5'-phosphate decarboxylase
MVNQTLPTNPILVALDVASAEQAVRLAKTLAPHVGGFKVGLELLMGPGPAVVSAVAELGLPVFCDAKLHDIPNTVEHAARQVGRMGARWLTVHASGGEPMMRAAVEGLADGSGARPSGVLAVTVLTSLDAATLTSTGVSGSPGRQVARLARLAAAAGVEGVVCSVKELGDVAQVAPNLVKVTPGVRPVGADAGDQARVATPAEAIERGADLLVIGRPITRAADPVAAAIEIAESLMPADVESSRQDR